MQGYTANTGYVYREIIGDGYYYFLDEYDKTYIKRKANETEMRPFIDEDGVFSFYNGNYEIENESRNKFTALCVTVMALRMRAVK